VSLPAKTADSAADPSLVRSELEKLLGSETFAQSESLKRFLRYVVEAKLEGREGEVKEQVLGSEVFERGESYDPRIDPIVRVQATRLRAKLRDYYGSEGVRSPLVIDLPKGSYVPSFSRTEAAPAPERTESRRMLRRAAAPIALAVLGLALLVLSLRYFRSADVPEPASDIQSIAVLPLTDLSGSPEHEYFGDAIAEEITTRLASVEGLKVAPRTSSFRFKGERVDLKSIASALGVDAVLQGSVRVHEEQLRAQMQLIRALDSRQLWSETYDRPLANAFEVQEEIASAVARAVRKKLAPREGGDARFVPATGAYADYLRATFEREKNSPSSLARSVELFESAIRQDPDFAPAHAGLVQAHVLNLLWGFAPPSSSREPARLAAERALSLAGDHPQALAAAAAYRLLYEWDFAGAEALLARGGNAAEIQLVRGILLAARGRLDEAQAEIDRAASGSPNQPLPHFLGAVVAFHRGDDLSALERAQSILKWAPDHPLTWLLVARLQDRATRFEEAEHALSRFETLASGAPSIAAAHRALHFARQGRIEEASVLARTLESAQGSSYVPPALLARVYASLGKPDAAFGALETARTERSFGMLFLAIDPDYQPLAADARFRALVERLGLGQRG
jgi:serine/threonine-protein kinase